MIHLARKGVSQTRLIKLIDFKNLKSKNIHILVFLQQETKDGPGTKNLVLTTFRAKRPVSNVLLPFLFTNCSVCSTAEKLSQYVLLPLPSILMGTSRNYKCVLDEKKITSSSLKDGTLTHQIRNNGFRKPLFLTHVPSSLLLTTLDSWRSQLSHFNLTSSQ